ncbi:hypothetical protein [Hoeflea marina]|nr:hypothetical protein [Hoeflea marina]
MTGPLSRLGRFAAALWRELQARRRVRATHADLRDLSRHVRRDIGLDP